MRTPTTNIVVRQDTDMASIAARKALLEARIEQQRIDVLVDAERWRHATQKIDAFYHAAQRWKAPIYGFAGVFAWQSLRRPKGFRQFAGRAFGLVMMARRLRRLIK